VTIPHKIRIMEFLDQLDPLAETIGAVNTICIMDGRTTGYNTDGEGFIRSLTEETGLSVTGGRFFLLGSGGAARAIAMTLAFKGAQRICICNRTPAKAEALAGEINKKIRPCAEVVEQTVRSQKEKLQDCQVLINTTSLGMHPDENVLPIEGSLLLPHLIVADIVYNPLHTKLLRAADGAGCTTVPGLGMLIYQGAAAFTLWTGVEPIISEMSDAVYSIMEKRQKR